MKEKVLISDDVGDIHYIKGPFSRAEYSLCGVRLHSVYTTKVKDKHAVSCAECLKLGKQSETFVLIPVCKGRVPDVLKKLLY